MTVGQFTLEQVRAFLCVVETGSFSAAGRVLRRSQPSITYLVRALEEQLQCRLFDRHSQGVALSAAGRSVLPIAQSLRDEAEQLASRAQALLSGSQEELSVIVDHSAPIEIVTRAMTSLQMHHSQLRIRIRLAVLDDITRELANGDADVGLTNMFASIPADMHRVAVATSGIEVVAAAGHDLAHGAVTSARLRQYAQIVLEDARGDIALRSFAILGSPISRVNSLSMMLDLVHSGIGFAVVPRHLVMEDLQDGRLVILKLPIPIPRMMEEVIFYLLWQSDRALSVVAQQFVDTVITNAHPLQSAY